MSARARVLAIGDELVHGQILDTNSGYVARLLERSGVEVVGFETVRDGVDEIAAAMRRAVSDVDVVVATGGLGPTEDDRTREVAALVAGVELVEDAHVLEHIEALFRERGRRSTPSNRRQALRPSTATLLDNLWGTAPGFALPLRRDPKLPNGGVCTFFALPGVPRELYPMLDRHLVPWLEQELPSTACLTFARLQVIGPSEAALGERLAPWMAEDRNPRVGITASGSVLSVRLAAQGPDRTSADALCASTVEALRPVLGDELVCHDDRDLHEVAAHHLMARGWTVATAESCTGGMVAELLTSVSGISAVFLGGFVTYTSAAKQRDLGVPAAMLDAHGEVSVEVAGAMARGAAEATGARIGIGITGIAGPGGGSDEKPVGLVCFGLSVDGEVRAWRRRLPPVDRAFVRKRAAIEIFAALLQLS